MPPPTRADLERWFASGVRAVGAHDATARSLVTLAPPRTAPHLLAIGKAAVGMAAAAVEWLAAAGLHPAGGLVVPAEAAPAPHPSLTVVPGDHPVPRTRSRAAADAIAGFVATLPAHAEVLAFLSGGASSLIATPREGPGAADLELAFTRLHAAGLPIADMNAERRTLTRWSDGRLAKALRHHRVRAWVISDVVGNDLATIGSGPLVGADVPHVIVADGPAAADAVAAAARAEGVRTVMHPAAVVGDATNVAAVLAEWLMAERRRPGRSGALHIFHGEVTVQLPDNPGTGGRAQHLALALAQRIAGVPDLVVLVAGTDGRDGNTDAAGAVISGDTLTRLREAGVDPAASLARADAGTALAAVGATLTTGATGTNVADLMLVWLGREQRLRDP